MSTRRRPSQDIGSIAVRWVRSFYILLICWSSAACSCTTLILWRSKAIARAPHAEPMMTRMTTNQRWQHLILLASFFVLVVTGFALKYPDSWFAAILGMSEHLRSIIHRIAGVMLIAAGIYHVFY